MQQQTNSNEKMLKGILIDPYKREVRAVEVRNTLRVWHQLLKCDCVDVQRFAYDPEHTAVDIWFDDEFLLKHPVGPGFKFIDQDQRERKYFGYALILCSDAEGNTVDLTVFNTLPKGLPEKLITIIESAFASSLNLQWEKWGQRVNPEDFVEQVMRLPEQEMRGDFRYLGSVLK